MCEREGGCARGAPLFTLVFCGNNTIFIEGIHHVAHNSGTITQHSKTVQKIYKVATS